MLDGIWPDRSDTMAVQRYVKMHFSDDWITYLYFAQWGDALLATDPRVKDNGDNTERGDEETVESHQQINAQSSGQPYPTSKSFYSRWRTR